MHEELIELLAPGKLPADVAEIEEIAREESETFLHQFNTSYWENQEKLNGWMASEEGRRGREKLAVDLWELTQKQQKTQLTAHDWRHTVLTTWSVEEILIEDKMNDYRLGAIIGAIMHDWGRIVEVKGRAERRASGGEYEINDEFHSKFSWWLGKKFFREYEGIVPASWQDLILQAVAEHSHGRNGYDADGEIAALVQTGDRVQLINAENYYRPQQEEVNERGTPLVTADGVGDYFAYVDFFVQRIPLIAGRDRAQKEERLKRDLRECWAVGKGIEAGDEETRRVAEEEGMEVVRKLWRRKLAENSEGEIEHFVGLVGEMGEGRRQAFGRGCALAQKYRARDEREMEEKMVKYKEIIEAEPLLKLGVKLWQN